MHNEELTMKKRSSKELPVTWLSEGQQIVGMLHLPVAERPVPAVVLLHGFTGTKVEAHRSFVKLSRALAESGMAVLRFDFRGSGDSEGDFSQMTVDRECVDAHSALEYVRSRAEVDQDQIGLLGMSLGGLVAALTSGNDTQIKSRVLWCPVGDPSAAAERKMDPSVIQQFEDMGFCDMGGWQVGKEFLMKLHCARPLEQVARCHSPMLLIQGTDDQTVPPSDSEMYEKALKKADICVERMLIPGANHTFSSVQWETQVLALTVQWFRTTLLLPETS